jgi:predicted RecA/RadA family phage recombinase
MENQKTKRRTPTRAAKVLITLAFIAAAAVTVTATLGYLISQSQAAVNTVTIGSIDVKVEEEGFTEGQTPTPGGDAITKKPTVVNETDTPAYIRARVVQGGVWELVGLNTTDWAKGDDGYYYYNAVLPGKGKTSEIFTSVKLNADANISDAGQLNIIVYAEAVQQWVDTSGFEAADEPEDFSSWDPIAQTAYKSFWALNHPDAGEEVVPVE